MKAKTITISVKIDDDYNSQLAKVCDALCNENRTKADIIRECIIIGAKSLWDTKVSNKKDDNGAGSRLNKPMSGFDKILEEERMKM